jgi:hypothetical protein
MLDTEIDIFHKRKRRRSSFEEVDDDYIEQNLIHDVMVIIYAEREREIQNQLTLE